MKFFFFLLLFSVNILSQVVYEPLHRDIYDYLAVLGQKGIIDLDDEIKPLSRIYIAEKLLEISAAENLTELEKEELEFYRKDFYSEINSLSPGKNSDQSLTYFSEDAGGRIRLFSYSDDKFRLNISPVLGIEGGTRDGEKLVHIWNGVSLYGYISDIIGFSFDFRDNTERGNRIDNRKDFTEVTGVNARSSFNVINYPENKIEYSEARTSISAGWSWGSFSAGKEFIEWGYGRSGRLVLSTKAPSYPYIRLDINPVEWFRFNYIHAWLSSDVIDSAGIYYTLTGDTRFHFREKYLASHTVIITPLKGLSFSLGESVVYSDKLEIAYLIPFMFFRLADHHLSRHYNAAGSNAQFFFSASSRNHISNTHFYGTLFIDEIVISALFDPARQRNQFGFALGGSVAVENMTITGEYNKIYPFVYDHYIGTTTYRSASYNLGHWMGGNADQVYFSLRYRFARGLQAEAWTQYIRKGEAGTPWQQQSGQPQPPFLFGLRNNFAYFGFSLKYELTHELFARGNFRRTEISHQLPDKRFTDSSLDEFYLALYYGL